MNLDFEKYSDNLIPTIVQDSRSGEVLMLGFSSAESFEQTKKTRKATFFSRSRQEMWEKGSTSGNTFNITSITYDCDADSLLYRCLPAGPACHTGKQSCFFEGEEGKTDAEILWSVYNTVLARKKEAPEGSYVASLYADGLDRIAQKVGEEAVETVIAAKNDDVDEFVGEFSDLLFHMMVLLAEKDVSLTSIVQKFHDRIK